MYVSHAGGALGVPSHARGVWNTEAQSKGAEGGSAETGGAQAAFRAGQIIGREMRAVGLDWNLAPVVDVNCNPQNRGIGIRSFSTDTGMVIRCARSFIRGLEESGVRSCLKHFPGLGGVENDPHLKLPVLNDSRSVIESRDLRPFREIPSACWMPTHVYVPALQSREEPVTLSREVLTDFIRGQLGFDGILVADDLNMGGVMNSVSLEEAVVRSFEAGMDVLSVCEGSERQCRAFEALEKAVSESEYLQLRLEESRERIQRFIDLRRDLPEGAQRAGVSELRLPESLRTAEDIARKAVVMVKQGPDIKGGMSFDNIFAMEMERQVPVEQTVNVRELEAARILGREMQCGCHFFSAGTLPEEEERLLGYAGKRRNLFFLENAYLNEDICSFVQRMLSVSAAHCVVALRNPWDADIAGVENAVCAYGYTPAQQKALLQFLRRKVLCTAAS
ncbi:MAG: glycoside hydrolase [Spirochaetales bacterium]|nr:MAG: glycoside hydrolase [Spirochaetales bacterium]